jgi:tetrapyrrole methylase family protein/MazG family protein
MDVTDRNLEREINGLRKTLRRLRGEKGCPWDREQDMDDIISYLIDEAYELLAAGSEKDWDGVEEEIGDVFFLFIFVHELLLEKRETALSDIISRAHAKIIKRHPHVFGCSKARDSRESLSEWERIKRKEKETRLRSGVMKEIPSVLPPVRKALAIQKKAAAIGFDWPDHSGIIDKFREELDELDRALSVGDHRRVKEEMGDLFFTAVNLARRLGTDPESALESSSRKFMARFDDMERMAEQEGEGLEGLTLDEMETLWRRSKKHH